MMAVGPKGAWSRVEDRGCSVSAEQEGNMWLQVSLGVGVGVLRPAAYRRIGGFYPGNNGKYQGV